MSINNRLKLTAGALLNFSLSASHKIILIIKVLCLANLRQVSQIVLEHKKNER